MRFVITIKAIWLNYLLTIDNSMIDNSMIVIEILKSMS